MRIITIETVEGFKYKGPEKWFREFFPKLFEGFVEL